MNSYVDQNGRRLSFERELGRGGEGAVYSICGDSNSVAKVYHDYDAEKSDKLGAMVSRANSQLGAVTAWPTRLIYNAATRRFAGFLMPRVDNTNPIQRLYNPRQRVQFFPKASWSFQVRTAFNLAAAFDEVHKAGCLVGDVNERNIQISAQALVRLVDCDSFQVQVNGKSFLCEVGVPQYIPPELQGRTLKGLIRTENHDRFGLAVLIYQLLFVGRHPYQGLYQGRDDPSFEQLIKEFRFAQGPGAASWAMAPPPHVPTFADIPPVVGSLFRRAFERGSENNNRPRPSEWLDSLGTLEKSIAKCDEDDGHAYWRGAADCTWCRLAAKGGPEYYFGIGDASRGFAIDDRKLQEVLKRLDQAERITAPFNRSQHQPSISVSESPLPAKFGQIGEQVVSLTERLRQSEYDCTTHDRTDQDHAAAQFKQFEAVLTRQFGPKVKAADLEFQEALAAVADERQRREYLEPLLFGPVLLGLGLALGALYHWTLGVIGGMMVIGFGACFAVYEYHARQTVGERRVASATRNRNDIYLQYSTDRQAAIDRLNMELRRRKESRSAAISAIKESLQTATAQLQREFDTELERLRQAMRNADFVLQNLESRWRSIVDTHELERRARNDKVLEIIVRCRSLASKYEAESKQVAAHAESAARARHLRLYSIGEANIPGIGFGRVQVLAGGGIYTAEDVEEYRIRRISGFGDVLTGRLLAWKTEVLGQFRFSPSAAAISGELRSLVAKCKTEEKAMHAEIDRQLLALGSLASKCREQTSSLLPELRRALENYERAKLAEANFRNAFSNRYAA
jgi:DNA-binding helix-hairpin-helix protein with protein kinase domain